MIEQVKIFSKIWNSITGIMPKYGNNYKIRHNNTIYSYISGQLACQGHGVSLNSQDYSHDGPCLDDYLESDLEPNNEQERKIIEDYNELVRMRYRKALEQDAIDYQNITFMIQYEEGSEIHHNQLQTSGDYLSLDLSKYITDIFSQYGIYVSVEILGDRCILVVLLD